MDSVAYSPEDAFITIGNETQPIKAMRFKGDNGSLELLFGEDAKLQFEGMLSDAEVEHVTANSFVYKP